MNCTHEDGCLDCLREEVKTLQDERNYLRGVLGKTLEGLQAAQGASNLAFSILGPPIPRTAAEGSREAAVVVARPRGAKFVPPALASNEDAKLMSIPEVARLWKRRENVVYYACSKGLIHHLKNREGKIRIRQDVALAYMTNLRGARRPGPKPKLRLVESAKATPTPLHKSERTLTITQAAKLLKIATRQVYRACSNGKLSFFKNAEGKMVIPKAAVEALVTKKAS